MVDFVLALLPWKLIHGLQMRTREKIGVSVAMSLGVLYVTRNVPFLEGSPANSTPALVCVLS
jgi:hypothetical protein